jgi:hypothetical protein
VKQLTAMKLLWARDVRGGAGEDKYLRILSISCKK